MELLSELKDRIAELRDEAGNQAGQYDPVAEHNAGKEEAFQTAIDLIDAPALEAYADSERHK